MRTLLELLPRIEHLGSREAIRFSNGYRTWRWSYEDLHNGIRRFVACLDSRGLRRGDRIVLWSENRPEWVAVFWACLARGVQVVPLDRQSSPEFARRIIAATRASLVIHSGAEAGLDSPVDCLPVAALERLPPGPRFRPVRATADDVVEIVYTSGTTAEPKGVIHLHRNICANLDPIREEIDRYKKWAKPFQPIRILDLLPLSHMFGQTMGVFIPLLLEGSAVFMTDLHPAAVRRTIRKERISVLVSVPRILDSLRADIERSHPRSRATPERPGSPLRRWWRHRDIHRAFGLKFWAFVVGGAALRPGTEAFWSRIGLLVIQGYGLTEASPVVAVNHPFRARPGTLGEAISGQEIRIARDGEILVRGDSIVAEYLEGGTRRARVADEDGWFHTGDIGGRDGEGRLVYKGRKKDVIVTADGLNVHPEDIESALAAEEGVRDAAVVPFGPSGAERVHAALILDGPGRDLEEIVERVNRRLEPHQRIQSASEWPEEEFPRTASTFKTQRHKVAATLRGALPPAAAERRDASGLDEILLELTGRRSDELASDRRLAEDLGMSSLGRIDMLASLERHYGIELDETALSTLDTVGEIREWVGRQSQSPGLHGDGDAPGKESGSNGSRPAAVSPPRWARRQPAASVRRAMQSVLFLPLFRHYIPLSVRGLGFLEDVAPPVIFAANHTSHLDTVALLSALPSGWRAKLAPAARQQHFFPGLPRPGPGRRIGLRIQYWLACGLFNSYPLSQDFGQIRDALRYTGELVGAGFCPLVYPEGMLSPDGGLRPFRHGIGLMAARLEVPVVPVHLHGLFDVMSVHDRWPRPGSVRVEFGSPVIPGSGEDYARLAERVETCIRGLETGSMS